VDRRQLARPKQADEFPGIAPTASVPASSSVTISGAYGSHHRIVGIGTGEGRH